MVLRKWEELPENMRLDEVRPYWEILNRKKFSLICKRAFDILASSLMLIVLSPLFLILAIAIKADSKGPVFYRQERITQYGRVFRIHKFRSMVQDADKKGSLVTVNNDSRVTKVGQFIRKFKLDEVSQLIDIWQGNMSYVGTRPEVKKYVYAYTPEMLATLLLPAGVTSTASIAFKDENEILDLAGDVDKEYIKTILPQKMHYNLEDIKSFSLLRDIKICVGTLTAVFSGPREFEHEYFVH